MIRKIALVSEVFLFCPSYTCLFNVPSMKMLLTWKKLGIRTSSVDRLFVQRSSQNKMYLVLQSFVKWFIKVHYKVVMSYNKIRLVKDFAL